MVSRMIGVVLGLSVLIVSFSADPEAAVDQDERYKELFAKIDDPFIDHEDVEAALLEINEDERDKIKIRGVSVAQILSYSNSTCDQDALTDPSLQQTAFGLKTFNQGVQLLLISYNEKRRDSCRDVYFTVVYEALRELGDKVLIPVQDLHLRKRAYVSKLSSLWRGTKTVPNCVKLIRKLSVALSFRQSARLCGDQPKVIEFANDQMETCKEYTEKHCKAPKEEFVADCESIREIGVSEETKEKRRAEQAKKDKANAKSAAATGQRYKTRADDEKKAIERKAKKAQKELDRINEARRKAFDRSVRASRSSNGPDPCFDLALILLWASLCLIIVCAIMGG